MVRFAKRRHNPIIWSLMVAFIGLMWMAGGVVADSQGSGADSEVAASQPATTSDTQALGRTLRNILYILVVLVGVFVVSSYAFIRWSRRYKRWLLREPTHPTPHEDVWPMHKLPPEDDEDEDSEPEEKNNDR